MFSCSDVTLWQHHRSQRSRSWSRTSDLNLIQSVNQIRTIGTDDCVSLWTVTENCWRQYQSRQQVLQYWVNVRRRHRIPKSMRSGHFLTSTSSHRSTTAWRLNCFRIVYIHYINDTTYIIYKYIFSTEYSSEYYTFGSIAKRIILQSYTLNSSQALSCAPHTSWWQYSSRCWCCSLSVDTPVTSEVEVRLLGHSPGLGVLLVVSRGQWREEGSFWWWWK